MLESNSKTSDNPPRAKLAPYGGLIGPLATIAGEPGQARKGAATACDSCAGMWLVRLPPNFPQFKTRRFNSHYLITSSRDTKSF